MGEKKEVKISLVSFIFFIIILVLLLVLCVVLGIKYLKRTEDTNEPERLASTNTINLEAINNSTSVSPNNGDLINVVNNTASNNTTVGYQKYNNLYWIFKGDLKTELVFEDKITIENGIAYLHKNGSKTTITSIKDTPKYISGWGEQTLMRVYILTEEGTIWMSKRESDGLNSDFEKVNLPDKVIDMTSGSGYRIFEPPYFLLENGTLVNADGHAYEELEGNFVNAIGDDYWQVFMDANNTLYTYNSNTRKYTQVKDQKGNVVTLKASFIQWSSIYANIDEELSIDGELVFIITNDNRLLYLNGCTATVAKEYKEASGKTVRSFTENPGTSLENEQNVKVVFTDNTELTFRDASSNYLTKFEQ